MPTVPIPIADALVPIAGPLVAGAVTALPTLARYVGEDPTTNRFGRLDAVLGWLPGVTLVAATLACVRLPDDASVAITGTVVAVGPIARANAALACGASALVAFMGAASGRGVGIGIASAVVASSVVATAFAGDVARVGAAGIHVAMMVAAIAMTFGDAGVSGTRPPGWRAASAYLTLGSLGLVTIVAGLSLADVLRVSPGGLVTEPFVIAVLAAGFALAIGLPPLHLWVPVVAWRPSAGSASLALGVVAPAAVGYLVQVLAGIPQLGGAALTSRLLTVGGLIACVVGAMGAASPGRMGRRVGYAAIAGIGPVLLGLGTGTRIGAAGAMVALAHHAVCTIILVTCAEGVEPTGDGRDVGQLADIAGSRGPNPSQGTSMAAKEGSGPTTFVLGERYSAKSVGLMSQMSADRQQDDYRLGSQGRRNVHVRGASERRTDHRRAAFILAAVAASGIPPVGGFASKWAIMQALSLADWRLGMAVGVTSLVTLAALLAGVARRSIARGVGPQGDEQASSSTSNSNAPNALDASSGAGGRLLLVYAVVACGWGIAPAWLIEHAWRATAQLGYLRPF